MSLRVMCAVSMVLLQACAGQPPAQPVTAGATAGMVCSSEARVGSHMATQRCITAEAARERHEASQEAMRNIKAPRPSGSAQGAQ
jgi:hypothetical protein